MAEKIFKKILSHIGSDNMAFLFSEDHA